MCCLLIFLLLFSFLVYSLDINRNSCLCKNISSNNKFADPWWCGCMWCLSSVRCNIGCGWCCTAQPSYLVLCILCQLFLTITFFISFAVIKAYCLIAKCNFVIPLTNLNFLISIWLLCFFSLLSKCLFQLLR